MKEGDALTTTSRDEARRYATPQEWLEAVEVFEGDEEALREHFAEIKAERQRQREEAERQATE